MRIDIDRKKQIIYYKNKEQIPYTYFSYLDTYLKIGVNDIYGSTVIIKLEGDYKIFINGKLQYSDKGLYDRKKRYKIYYQKNKKRILEYNNRAYHLNK